MDKPPVATADTQAQHVTKGAVIVDDQGRFADVEGFAPAPEGSIALDLAAHYEDHVFLSTVTYPTDHLVPVVVGW